MPSFNAIRRAQVSVLASLVEPMGMIQEQEKPLAAEHGGTFYDPKP